MVNSEVGVTVLYYYIYICVCMFIIVYILLLQKLCSEQSETGITVLRY